MKRLLGLFALVLLPALLAVPARASAVASEPQAQAVRTITVADIAARARRVIGVVNRSYLPRYAAELATLATPATLEFLRGQGQWVAETPSCKRAAASRPGDTVWACRIAETGNTGWVPAKWWLYFRKVDGRWTAVNQRLASSVTVYRTARNLSARTDKILDAAWAQDWATVAQHVSPALLSELKSDIEGSIGNPPAEAAYAQERSGGPCTVSRTPGQYLCAWLVAPDSHSKHVRYRNVDGHWQAYATVKTVFD